MRRTITALAAAAALLGAAPAAYAQTRTQTRAAWAETVDSYGLGLLQARLRCESGGNGGYALQTTGNGYWFAFQFNVAAWDEVGGRVSGGKPLGKWTEQPGPLEQQYRAAALDLKRLIDPWPNCP